MATQNRPLSPHLQVYRPQLTSILSILHRATGVVLALSVLLITWWFVALAGEPASYQSVQAFFTSWFGSLLLFGWTFCSFYHLCNGIRHLCWDAGIGFEIPQVYLSGKVVLGISVVLTALVWLICA